MSENRTVYSFDCECSCLRSDGILFAAPLGKKSTALGFGAFGKMGAAPLGMETIVNSAKLNNTSLWLTSQVLLRYGVLSPKAKLKIGLIEQRIDVISRLYPVNDQVRAFGVAVHEKENLRGFHLLGDDLDVATLWAALFSYTENIREWDVAAKAMCWTAMVPGTVYVPYLDLDEKGTEQDFHRVWTERVSPTISCIQKGLAGLSVECKPFILFNSREVGDLWKFSFHIHWPALGVAEISAWKAFLVSLPDMPRKLIWTKTGESWTVTEDPRTPIFDRAVYGGTRQLFRGPFCGKEGNLAAVMRPCVMTKNDRGEWCAQRKEYNQNDMIKYILLARIARSPVGLTVVAFAERVVAAAAPVVLEADEAQLHPEVVSDENSAPSPLLDFVMPFFLSQILPMWQKKRYDDALRTKTKGAVVPHQNLKLIKNVPSRRPGARFMAVEGDTFCYTDPDHVHRQSPHAVGFCVDFVNTTIKQTCFACGSERRAESFCFLHLSNRIEIVREQDCAFTATSFWGTSKSVYQLLLDYFPELFVFQRSTRTLWVFDRFDRIWRNELAGNMIVGRLVDELNEKHSRYLQAYKSIVVRRQVDAFTRANESGGVEDLAACLEKVHAEARKFMTDHTPFITLGPAARGKVLEDLRNYHVHKEIREMNAFPHLIPMKTRKYINVFTGEIGDMEPHHFFTSCVDAEYIPDGEDTARINAWFEEISTGDREKALYLKRFAAYSFTYLVHDRKFLVLKGNGKNGKGAWKEFVMIICKGPEGFDSRGKNLLQNYWDKRGNANTSPENATPESYELMNKTFLYTDDIMPIPLDANKLKRTVGAEDSTGRGLYGKPVDIKVRGKVVWTSNYDPDGPGEDIAYWDRCVLCPMLTRYVPPGIPTNANQYRFAQNHVAYLELLELKDAFFSVSVRALIAYYSSLPWNRAKNSPALLSSLPLPDSVVKYTQASREKQLPLAAFMKEYTKRETLALNYARVEDLFENYMIFLENINESKLKKDTTQNSFEKLLAIALEVNVARGRVEGRSLCKRVVSTKKRQFEEHSYGNLGGGGVAPQGNGYVEGSALDAAMPPTRPAHELFPMPLENDDDVWERTLAEQILPK